MQSKTAIVLCVILILAGVNVAVADDQVMFNYQGRVRVQGTPYDGTGYFKFAIVNNPGTITLWSNDGTSVDGGQPTASVSVPVTEGIFNVMVGDPDLGMEPINRSIFNHPSQIKLRIWFSDGTHGFQRLLPDRRITNPTLMGIRTGTEDFTIYVNGEMGNDDDNGLTTDTAKLTIQAAADVLPERLRCNVTIDIADGFYREEVKVFGITVEPGKTLSFFGDENWTPSSPGDPSVRITGADEDISPTKVRNYGIWVQKCSGIILKGILFDYASSSGVNLTDGSSYQVRNCKAVNNHAGFAAGSNASTSFTGCIAEHNDYNGFHIGSNSWAGLSNCVSKYNSSMGLTINTMAAVSFYNSGEFSNNSDSGIYVVHNSKAWFSDSYSGDIRNNAKYGIQIRYDSYTEDHTKNSFSGNGISNLLVDKGGHTYN